MLSSISPFFLFLTMLGFLQNTVALMDYSIRYVEDDCKIGNETITYILDPSSPQKSTVILQAVKYFPYSPNKDCMVVLTAPPDHGIVLSIRKIDFIYTDIDPVSSDYLKVILPFRSQKFSRYIFDLAETRSFYTDGPLKLLYHSESRQVGSFVEIGFEVIATVVADGISQCSESHYFRCTNNMCISKLLICDGHNNCGDKSDESVKVCDSISYSLNGIEEYLIYICVAALFVLSMVTTMSYMLYKQKLRMRSSASSDSDTSPRSRYEAMHPASNFCTQNPDGSRSYTNFSRPLMVDRDGGISNPYYTLGPPPPPYKP